MFPALSLHFLIKIWMFGILCNFKIELVEHLHRTFGIESIRISVSRVSFRKVEILFFFLIHMTSIYFLYENFYSFKSKIRKFEWGISCYLLYMRMSTNSDTSKSNSLLRICITRIFRNAFFLLCFILNVNLMEEIVSLSRDLKL